MPLVTFEEAEKLPIPHCWYTDVSGPGTPKFMQQIGELLSAAGHTVEVQHTSLNV